MPTHAISRMAAGAAGFPAPPAASEGDASAFPDSRQRLRRRGRAHHRVLAAARPLPDAARASRAGLPRPTVTDDGKNAAPPLTFDDACHH